MSTHVNSSMYFSPFPPKDAETINRAQINIRGSDFIWDFRKLPFPSHLGKYIIKNRN